MRDSEYDIGGRGFLNGEIGLGQGSCWEMMVW